MTSKNDGIISAAIPSFHPVNFREKFNFSRRFYPMDILIFYRCWRDIVLDIAMILLVFCRWNTWRCQFAISTWHQGLEIGPIRLLMSSWHRRVNGRYPAERNPPGSYATSVSATIMPCFYCGNWKIKASGNFFSVATSWGHHVLMTSWGCP